MILLNPAHGVKNTWLNSNKEEQTRIISQAWKTKGKREFIGREGKLRRWRWSSQSHRMTNMTACNKGALVHGKKKEDVRPATRPSFKQSPSKLSKAPQLLLLLRERPNSLWIHQTDAVKGRNGVGGGRARGAGVGPAWTDFPVGGGRLLYGWFPCSQQLHFHKLRGGKSRAGGRGDSRKTERGLRREWQKERKLGPKASKVAKGEKWRSNTVNASTRGLNKASYGPASYSDLLPSATRILAPKEWRQIFLQVELTQLFSFPPHGANRWPEFKSFFVVFVLAL